MVLMPVQRGTEHNLHMLYCRMLGQQDNPRFSSRTLVDHLVVYLDKIGMAHHNLFCWIGNCITRLGVKYFEVPRQLMEQPSSEKYRKLYNSVKSTKVYIFNFIPLILFLSKVSYRIQCHDSHVCSYMSVQQLTQIYQTTYYI